MPLTAAEAQPSAWVVRFAPLIAPGAQVLDLACGGGRHLKWLVQHGWRVTGVDRDSDATAALRVLAEIVSADLEGGPWPLPGRLFDGIVVTHYLWRPLLPWLRDSLRPGGVLIYETFAHGQQSIGKPSRPDFLLQPGELLSAFAGLRVVAFEDGFIPEPARFVQRLVAVNEAVAGAADSGPPPRYNLVGPGS